ncbi:hypothetical protein M408DRAFT_25497, partial [Serendipita vermifera MAFF 305830]
MRQGWTEAHSNLDQDLQELQSVEAHITSLEDQLRIARARQAEVYQRILTAQALQAPIRRIPNELLTLIFEEHSVDQRKRNSSLIRVCKLWHELVMRTPTLWSHIVLEINGINQLPNDWRYAIECLYRSRPVLLDITVNASGLRAPTSGFHQMEEAYDSLSAYEDDESDRLWDLREESPEWTPHLAIYE